MNPGADLLDRVATFTGRYVAYPSEAAHRAHVLWIAHTFRMDLWDSTPRIAFLSPEPGSGKTRALEVTELLVPRPILAVDCTPAYLFRKVADEGELPTILHDEIDTVFGPKAPDNEGVRGMLNAGYRKGAVAGRCEVHGRTIATIEMAAYCAVALAGLNDLPDTLMSRSVVVRMRRRAPDEVVAAFRRRDAEREADELHGELSEWMADLTLANWPEMPDGIEDRNAEIWESLLVIADTAGGHWPETARVAAVALVADSMRDTGTLGVRLLTDLKAVFGDRVHLLTAEILDALNGLTESPWGDLRGKPLDARGLARRLMKYGVKPANIRVGEAIGKGYRREDLHDPWSRYVAASEDRDQLDTNPKIGDKPKNGTLPPAVDVSVAVASPLSPIGSATSATAATADPDWALSPDLLAADPEARA
jgi:hypothetical protein